MAATGIMTATQAERRSAADVRRRRFTRADHYVMGRARILDHRERLELIGGEMFVTSPIGRRHGACVDWIMEAFFASDRLAGRARVRVRNPLVHDRIEVYTDPAPGGYRTSRRVERGETVAPTALPDLRLAVDRIIPGRPGGENRGRATP